jgi:hypothetical protein
VTISIRFTDLGLLDSTTEEYLRAIEAGTTSESEAVQNLEALALGMMEIEADG